jgi:hypothetical protein
MGRSPSDAHTTTTAQGPANFTDSVSGCAWRLGLWERITSINDSWLGWNSTLRFHVWPWPFKFAVVQNIPAFLIGLMLSWPIDSFKPGLPEWVSLLPSLLLVPLLWYLIGAWLDRKRVLGRTSGETVMLTYGVFTAVSLIVAVSSGWIFGSYTTFIPLGIVYWIALAIATYLLGRRWARVGVPPLFIAA